MEAFVKSGSTAAAGLVPKPSTTAGTTKYLREDATWVAPPNTNTTYTFATGSSNGTISVTPSGGSATDVAVKGLGSAAYTASTAYLDAGIGHYGSSAANTEYYITTNYTTTTNRCYLSGMIEGMNGRGNRLATVRFAVEWSGSAFVHGAYWDLNGLIGTISFNTNDNGIVYKRKGGVIR